MGTGIDAFSRERRGGLCERCAGHERGGEIVAAGREDADGDVGDRARDQRVRSQKPLIADLGWGRNVGN